jgi:gliding motility-associated-like protein
MAVKFWRLLAMLVIALGATKDVLATHLVGGEFSYTYLGTNNQNVKTYRIQLALFRDCQNGSNEALTNDQSGSFGLYSYDTKKFVWADSIKFLTSVIVPANFSNSCLTNAPTVCLSRMLFQFDLAIPDNTNGYMLVYQRCCRNEAQNIDNPNGTVVGSTYFININPGAGPNNSAVFKNYPPQIICINNPLIYDHSAVDADGDSLSYEFCDAFDIPSSISDPNPSPSMLLGPDFFQAVPYTFGFTSALPIPGNPALTIDAKTGIITGTPNIQGRYVVTVCCHEWRNGIKVGTTRRDFQFVITNCSKVVVANIPVLSQEPNTYIISCQSKTVDFQNLSTGGFSYYWDFGVAGTTTDTSTLKTPTYTYPDTGTYKVKLIVNGGSTCPDSIERFVKVYPEFIASYTYNGLLCPGERIQFTDGSFGSLAPPDTWTWIFGDGTTKTEQNPSHAFTYNGGTFPVKLISGNSFGCRDTAIQNIKIGTVSIRTGEDTVVIKNLPIEGYVTGSTNVTWDPPTYMDNPNSVKPIFNFPQSGTYAYSVTGITPDGCVGYDSIVFEVVDDITFFVPNAFTPNGDGVNDYAKIIQAGYGKLDYFKIFDRYGKELFGGTSFRQFWNGTYNNKECDQGVYFWVIKARNLYNEEKIFKGDITLLR